MTEFTELVAELLGHNDGKVEALVHLIDDIHSNLKDGLLTKEEFDSLMNDVERFKKVIVISNDLQLNAKINQVIHLLMEAAKYAKF